MNHLSEVGEDYAESLKMLVSNSKPQIQSLTEIAAENADMADEIAFVIVQRVYMAPPDQKISALYLLDSITKRVGGPYIWAFRKLIIECFSTVFLDANASHRKTLLRLLNTWPDFYPEEYRRLCTMTDTAPPPHARPAPDRGVGGDGRSGPVRLEPRIQPALTRQPPNPSSVETRLPDSAAQLLNPQLLSVLSTALAAQSQTQAPPAPPPPPPPSVKPPEPPVDLGSLYSSSKFQCQICGWRLDDARTLDTHMDWHFEEKKRKAGNAVQSRQWFVPAQMWVSNKGEEPSQQAPPPGFFEEAPAAAQEVSRVPVDDEQPICPLCGEEFEVDYDDESEEWMCIDAMVAQVRDIQAAVVLDKIVHVNCYTQGTVPVITPGSGPTSPDLHSIQPPPKRELEDLDRTESGAKRIKCEQPANPEDEPSHKIKQEPE